MAQVGHLLGVVQTPANNPEQINWSNGAKERMVYLQNGVFQYSQGC